MTSPLPALVLGFAALLLHMALLLGIAPVAAAVTGWIARGVPPFDRDSLVLRPWRRLLFLMRKAPVRTQNASGLAQAAPLASLAVTLTAAALVPSFALGLSTAPLDDLAIVLALLAFARVLLLLGALDPGIAAPGQDAAGQAARLLLVLPACLLALFTLSLPAGTTSLEAMLSAVRTVHAGASAAMLLAALALGLSALAVASDGSALTQELSGPDLALVTFGMAVQRVVWIDLVTDLLLPQSLGAAAAGPLVWLTGLLGWLVRLLAGCLVLGLAQRCAGRLGVMGGFGVETGPAAFATAGRLRLAGLATVLALLAPLLAGAGAA